MPIANGGLVTAILFNTNLHAASCGSNCEVFFEFAWCVGEKLQPYFEENCPAGSCNDSSGEMTAARTSAKTACETTFKKKYSGTTLEALLALSELISKHVEALHYDYQLTSDDPVVQTETIREATKALIIAVFANSIDYGYNICTLPQGYYIQPGSANMNEWGKGLTCNPCPPDGSAGSESGSYPVFITSCYLPAGSFTDTSGSGKYNGICPFVPDGATAENLDDILWAM